MLLNIFNILSNFIELGHETSEAQLLIPILVDVSYQKTIVHDTPILNNEITYPRCQPGPTCFCRFIALPHVKITRSLNTFNLTVLVMLSHETHKRCQLLETTDGLSESDSPKNY